jgi:predicted RNA-binding Zn-ribbon protein involved in translation (DUF1610 family)
MGSIIKAVCECGFSSPHIYAGGGFLDFRTSCKVPAICYKCDDIVVVNYLRASVNCPKCGEEVIFYNDPSLRKESTGAEGETELDAVFSWRMPHTGKSFCLPATQYLCPKCGKMTLKFYQVGNWD